MLKNKYLYVVFLLLIICVVSLIVKINDSSKNDISYRSNVPYHIIAYSAGEIDEGRGYYYTNSLEAYQNSYKKGIRMFDADLRFTKDGVLVLRHEWTDNLQTNNDGKIMNYDDFINNKIYQKYTPMSFNDLLDFMISHDDIIVFTDIKHDTEPEKMKLAYEYIVNAIKGKNRLDLLDRFVISFYNYDDYFLAKSVYDFKHFAMRKYPNYRLSINKILKFCKENNIEYLNIFSQYYNKRL